MAEMTVKEKKMLVADIKNSYQRVRDTWKSAIEQSIEFGGQLTYCKSQIEHGRWLVFLEACGIPPRTATGMMRMHEHRELLREKSAESWADAARIMQAVAIPNRQRIADLESSEPVVNGQSNAHLLLTDSAVSETSNHVAVKPESDAATQPPVVETKEECVKRLVQKYGWLTVFKAFANIMYEVDKQKYTELVCEIALSANAEKNRAVKANSKSYCRESRHSQLEPSKANGNHPKTQRQNDLFRGQTA